MSKTVVEGKYVVILSGGLDSTTLLYDAITEGCTITSCVSFNYGQRHKKELVYAALSAKKFGLKHHVIDLWSSGFTDAISSSGSVLVSDTPVPLGHYAADTMKATVVPNRNMVMISIAGAIAVAEGAHGVLIGVHAGDHAVYPDCRPLFIGEARYALFYANEGFGSLQLPLAVAAPFLHETKTDIATRALQLDVPLHETWSCYQGGDKHCGKCGTCVERLEAIHEALARLGGAGPNDEPFTDESVDHTEYEDREFWKTATANV